MGRKKKLLKILEESKKELNKEIDDGKKKVDAEMGMIETSEKKNKEVAEEKKSEEQEEKQEEKIVKLNPLSDNGIFRNEFLIRKEMEINTLLEIKKSLDEITKCFKELLE
ncbi:MAG TPA: hypothetical protein VGB37_14350 [Candidatus Lokiarchaeia archaeon]